LIRVAELLNDQTIIYFMKHFNKNVGISQILVLNQLRENGLEKQSRLAKRLGYTPGAMTVIANKLTQERYAKRVYNERDRCMILIDINNKHEDLLYKAQKQSQKLLDYLYSVLTEKEINEHITIQRKLLDHVMTLNK